MKSVMKFLPLFVFSSVGIVFTGCYTEFAAREYNNDQYYAETDTSYDEESNITVNNNYYLDDDYRRSRFRVSFNYYYPSYHSSWIASYYYSYYDDPYWGWGRPYGYYDPWRYGCVYWPPVWDPWYPYPYYYPPIAYYPVYYSPPIYVNNTPGVPGRSRQDGSTRDTRDPNGRTRPVAITSPGTNPAVGETATRVRGTSEVNPVNGRRDEVPWWKRTEGERVRNGSSQRSSGTREARPAERRSQRDPQASPSNSRKTQAAPAERRRESTPSASQPSRRSSGNGGSRSAERPRESRQPSYNPPPSQPAPSTSSPPRSSGGGSSGGSGRRRN